MLLHTKHFFLNSLLIIKLFFQFIFTTNGKMLVPDTEHKFSTDFQQNGQKSPQKRHFLRQAISSLLSFLLNWSDLYKD